METSYLLLHSEAVARKTIIKGVVQYELYVSLEDDLFSGNIFIRFFTACQSDT